jgi:hypothetical protein
MDCTYLPRRLLRVASRLAAVAASAALLCPVPAFADQIEQHNELVQHYITDMHANPLVADCAAHGDFVASTSTAFDHVEFPPSSFDSAHSSITPWNDSFDERKQRVKVDTIVTVEGLGVRQNGTDDPAALKFRCGYVGNQMLAFSWNDPVPPLRPHYTRAPARHHVVKGRHVSGKRFTGKHVTRHTSPSSRTSSKKKVTKKKKH